MKSNFGTLIAIEGVDGAGKNTQLLALRRELERLNFRTSAYSFPDYSGSRLGSTVKKLLSGEFGDATKIHPAVSAPLFALERSEKRDAILGDLNQGRIVLCDRYVYSNVAHQACRLPLVARDDFRKWLEELEFDILGLPRPRLTILLDVDDAAASERRRQRARDSDMSRPLDDYERDETTLTQARHIYLDLASMLGWIVVSTTEGGRMLGKDEITLKLLAHVAPFVERRNDA